MSTISWISKCSTDDSTVFLANTMNMVHLVHLLLIGICLQNGRALAGEPPAPTRTTTASTPGALNSDLVNTDNSDTTSEQHEGSPSQPESDEEVVEPKNATEIPEKTNVTEETIENIVLPEKPRKSTHPP
jgi:hypothetical protein